MTRRTSPGPLVLLLGALGCSESASGGPPDIPGPGGSGSSSRGGTRSGAAGASAGSDHAGSGTTDGGGADQGGSPAVASPEGASALALAAQGLAAGQWIAWKANDSALGDALMGTNSPNCDWMNKATFWGGTSPYHGRLAFHASPANSETPWYTVFYEELTDTWSREAGNLPTSQPGHGYDHNCIDPVDGIHYSAVYYDDARIQRLDMATKTWLADLAASGDVGQVPAYSLVWHEDPPGLVWLAGGDSAASRLAFWRKSSQTWELLSNELDTGAYHTLGAHNAAAAISVVGGGNGSDKLYRVFDGGGSMVVEPLLAAPPFGAFSIANGGDDDALLAPNPNDRTFIFLTGDGSCWELDAGTASAPKESWSACADPVAPFDGPTEAVLNAFVTPIPSYGVLLYAKLVSSGSGSVALFKP